jgi:hypothetical protein
MLNLIDLEKRWIRYKIKSYIPHIIISFSIIIITILAFVFVDFSKKTDKQPITKKPDTSIEKIIKENNIKIKTDIKIKDIYKEQKTDTIQKVSDKQLKITPSLSFVNQIQSQNRYMQYQNSYEEKKISHKIPPPKEVELDTPSTVVKEDIQKVKEPTKVVETKEKHQIQEVAAPQEHKDNNIVIQRQDTQNDIYEIIKRFKKNHNPALSLFVAKKYYELGYYHQSYNYALVTNELNSEIEDSWIIFSKSLVKLGQKDKAVKILKRYIINSHSSNAQILLNDINSGKFK